MAQSWNELNIKMVDYFNSGDYLKGAEVGEKALMQAEKEFGTEHLNYATTCNTLGVLYFNLNKFQEAVPLFIIAKGIYKAELGEKSGNYASAVCNLATLYNKIGQYDEAEKLFLIGLECRKEILGEQNLDYSTTLNNIALLYENKGKYKEAEVFYKKEIEILEDLGMFVSTDYAIALNNLAHLYVILGYYANAEKLYRNALQIFSEILGNRSRVYALTLGNLATIYKRLGDYEKAEPLYVECSNIIKGVSGESSPDFAASITDLALFYYEIGKYESAEPLFLKASEIQKNTFTERSSQYATTLNDLALLYWKTHNLKKAEELYLKVKDIYYEIYGNQHPYYAICISNLALLFGDLGRFDEAIPLLVSASKINEEFFDDNHPHYEIALQNIASVYEKVGLDEKVEPCYLQSIDIINNQIINAFDFLTEPEREVFYKTVNYKFENYVSFFYRYSKNKPSVTGHPFNIELAQKGIILRSVSEERNTILSSKDSNLINTYNSFTNLKAQLAFFYSQPQENQKKDSSYIRELEGKANEFEKLLIIGSKAFRISKETESMTWENIRDQLTENEAAVEFSNFRFHDGQKWTDSTYYCALIVRRGYAQPEMKFLFEQKQLDSILSLTGSDEEMVNLCYSDRGIIIPGNSQNKKISQLLFELVWEPLESSLIGVDTVYFSPSGSLHKISFAAISTPDSDCLVNKYYLVQLGSTRQIVKYKAAQDYIDVADSAIVFGGIDYEWAEILKDTAPHFSQFFPSDIARTHSLSYLPGTMKEAKVIDSLFRKGGIDIELHMGSKATKTVFLNVSGQAPQIIHIATHGFFFPLAEDTCSKDFIPGFGEQVYRFSENPLLRSGLLFAGANAYWSGKEEATDGDNGILTAYEISNMDLSNTKLVVLSACQTGLGDIKGNEGVFGLQRALKMAGVKNIIMSMWSIPDKETQEFMGIFYNYCFSGESIQNSFTLAQREMQIKYPDEPYKWAGFVLFQ